MAVVEIHRGTSPIILSFPHIETYLPPAIWARLNDNGRILSDTDWHVDRLYEGLLPNLTTVRATFHRYVIDANRDPTGISLYPGQYTTSLIPQTDFDGRSIWPEEAIPSEADTAARLVEFHVPYHAALLAEIERLKALHGVVLLYDCHSIRSHIPHLFQGKLPDFNIGTDGGVTCDRAIEAATVTVTHHAHGFDAILNGRFKGGWTTRHYGRPEMGVHAIQMELAQSTYLPDRKFDSKRAPAADRG
jgi:N-formylglutamate deformylase